MPNIGDVEQIAAGAGGSLVRQWGPQAAGEAGPDGASAYDIAVANGFPGDEAAWLASLVGAAGSLGSPGAPGSPGSNGTNGADGKTVRYGIGAPGSGTGADGDFYIATDTNYIYGPKVTAWPTGTSLVGPAGTNGTNGTNGAPGATGAQGGTSWGSRW